MGKGVASDSDDFEEEEKLMQRRGIKNKTDPKNKLKLGEFHRNNIAKKKSRKPSLKKQLRDTQRLLERQGLPDEVKLAKQGSSKELKVKLKKQQEAVRFDLRYKKIKFTEKRKIIRKLEQFSKGLKETPEDESLLKKQKQYKDYLTYINHYPPLWKYISLFPD